MINNWKKWGVLFGTGLSSMLVSIDFTIVNTSLSAIQKSLSVSLTDLQWIISAFGIPFCVLLVICGRLADLLGRKLILFIGMSGFALSSLAAGFSSSAIDLIISRFFLGTFGAAIFPCGMALTADVFPKKQHGKALGIYFGLLGVGLAIGPVIGGLLTTFLSWHWIFFINLPILLLSAIFCVLSIPASKLDHRQRLDWKGLIFFFIGLTSLIVWITEGPTIGWTSIPSLSFGLGMLVFLTLFYRSERQNPCPIIPFHLFRKRTFIIATLSDIAGISAMWALIFIVPLFLQTYLHYDEAKAGLMMLIMTAMTVIVPPLAGHLLDKQGIKPILSWMFIALLGGYGLLLFFSHIQATWCLILSLIFLGFGWGSANGIGGPIVLSGHPSTVNAGLITGASTTILNVFGVIFLAQSSTILRLTEQMHLNKALGEQNISLTPFQKTEIFNHLAQPYREVSQPILLFFEEAFLHGFQMTTVFLMTLTFILFVLMLLTLRKTKKIKAI